MPVKQLKSIDSKVSYKLKHVEPNCQTNNKPYLAGKHLDNKVRELTNTEGQQIKEKCIEKVISQKNLSALTEEQKEAAIKMLQEEADSPLDETPITRKFNRVPNLFRDMLRTYLNEAGLRGLVPIILHPLLLCWKKNGSLHLYCDYRQLNLRQDQTDSLYQVSRIPSVV